MEQSDVHILDELKGLEDEQPILIVALEGFLDAGQAASSVADQLVAESDGSVVASFDIDAFYDYRSRRPPITFVENHYEGYEQPRLTVRALNDRQGQVYLLLSGPEPDFRWEAFVRGVLTVIERLKVRLTVQIGSVPMAVPHTRPAQVTQHATAEHLLRQSNVWSGEIRVPASAQALMEVRLGEAGLDAMGYVVHVPHYLAQTEDKAGALRLLSVLSEATGLDLNDGLLAAGLVEHEKQIAEQVAGSSELQEMIAGLESQYDTFHAAEVAGSDLMAHNKPLPTAEEIGADFEKFLAGLDQTEED